jgi:hypothetical protein
MAMMDADADGGTTDYFDKNMPKDWTGLEHWKLRKVTRKRECVERGLSCRFTERFFVPI